MDDRFISPWTSLLLLTVTSLLFVQPATAAADRCGGCRRSFSKCYLPQPICEPPDQPCCDGFVQVEDNCTYDASLLDEKLDVTAKCADIEPIPQGTPWAPEEPVTGPVTQNADIFLNNILRNMPSSSDDQSIAPQIINGKFANYGQFPWQIVLAYNGFFTCGATIISPWWVITAAHCVDGRSAANFLVLGGVDRLSIYDSGQVVKNVKHIVKHRRYKFPYADLALMKVTTPFVWTPNVQPACLPRECDVQNAHAVKGVKYTISGHGAINPEGDIISDQLQYAEVVIKRRKHCARVFDNKNFKNVLCVDGIKGDYQGSCKGDSGGPLTYNNVLLGVTSFGATTCGTYPFGYTHISPYLTWMRTKISKKKYQ